MTAPHHNCEHHDCCPPADDEDSLEVIGERVVKHVVEEHIEALMSRGPDRLSTENVAAMGKAVTKALAKAAPGVAFRLAVQGGLYEGRTTATCRVGEYELMDRPDTINISVGGGLCVISGPHHTWIVHAHAPAGHGQAEVAG